MAIDVKQQQAQQPRTSPLPKRCGERVKMARIQSTAAITPLPPSAVLRPGDGNGRIGEMALHPWGLAVVCGEEVVVIPSSSVVSVVLAEGE